MKTHIILLGIATALLVSCQRKAAIKSGPCCAKDEAALRAGISNDAEAGNSIYQLQGVWTDQHQKQLTLSKLKGRPQIVAMIFTHCTSVCPRIVEQMKAIRDSLPASIRKNVGGVLVSFDPQRDTPAQLSMFAAQRQLDDQWELLKGNDDQVRELSMALNVKYQKLAGGQYSHSGNIYILDKQGNIAAAVDGLSGSVHNADKVLARLVQR
ncbi:MAG: SCO family protein [Bacteroidetes bacterium]|nr:SCO family protein [Bacteroidota bacterium]